MANLKKCASFDFKKEAKMCKIENGRSNNCGPKCKLKCKTRIGHSILDIICDFEFIDV